MVSSDDTASMLELGKLLNLPPRTIEILPGETHIWRADGDPTTTPYPFVEGNLGIPRKSLYRAYLTACPVFVAARKALKAARNDLDHITPDLVNSSSVILLANPAHHTALNSRKKCVQTGSIDARTELAFMTALQTCRDCAKESILWNHRRWLLRFLYGKDTTVDAAIPCIPPESLHGEFDLVFHACETYPRNYYAWTHWHYSVNALCASIRSESTPTEIRNQLIDLLSEEVSRIRRWVELHVSDHSAVHQLCELYRRLSLEPIVQVPSPITSNALDHALELVNSYPSHESLWLYLRMAVYFPNERKHEQIQRCLQSFGSLSSDVSQLACRTLAWWAYETNPFPISPDFSRTVINGGQTTRPSVKDVQLQLTKQLLEVLTLPVDERSE